MDEMLVNRRCYSMVVIEYVCVSTMHACIQMALRQNSKILVAVVYVYTFTIHARIQMAPRFKHGRDRVFMCAHHAKRHGAHILKFLLRSCMCIRSLYMHTYKWLRDTIPKFMLQRGGHDRECICACMHVHYTCTHTNGTEPPKTYLDHNTCRSIAPIADRRCPVIANSSKVEVCLLVVVASQFALLACKHFSFCSPDSRYHTALLDSD